ncbi:MAG: hypothetical protein GTN53_37665 [Candidatus Aminicenantes bacterium]|nr:hypothetical protein [Candidatus Aminicenantes bacterium]NIQ72211.1 hypothetical protein [Candidatus Aminicenantes bacterium]NIT28247.1 hypothetical protein [Candidatus Aminicenantes bacterium]
MYVKIVTLKKVSGGYAHASTVIHEAETFEAIDEPDENDKKKMQRRRYVITRGGESITVLSKPSDKEIRHDVFIENENGDTIGKY